jgi:hypothetical protein
VNAADIIRVVGPLTAAKLVAEVLARHPDAFLDTSEFPILLSAAAAAQLEAGLDSALLSNTRVLGKRALVLPQHELALLESLARVGFDGEVVVQLPVDTPHEVLADVKNNVPPRLKVEFLVPPTMPSVTPAGGYVLLHGINVGAGYFRFSIAALEFVSIYRGWFTGEIVLIDPVVGRVWMGASPGWAMKRPNQVGVTQYLTAAAAA